jgi:methionyl-tRNA synthetase
LGTRICRRIPGQQDVLRYALLSSAPETKDNNFTWKDFQTKNNSELVGIFGNFINRVAVLIHKYYDGVVPQGNVNSPELRNQQAAKEIEFLENYEFRNSLTALMNLLVLETNIFRQKNLGKPLKTILKKRLNPYLLELRLQLL